MNPFICRATLFSASLAALLLVSACGKQEAAPASGPAAAVSAAAAPSAPKSAAKLAASVPATAPSAGGTAAVPPTAAVADAISPIAVVKLTLGDAIDDSHQVAHPSHTFTANTKIIYASVTTSGHTTDATLNAKWSYLEGRGQLVSSISQSIATTGQATTTFKVQNPDLWPEGKYEVDISLDGKSAIKQTFAITKS